MKRILLLTCFAALALGQSGGPVDINMTANRQWKDGNVFRLAGNVRIETAAFSLRADAADFNQQSREIQARGNVVLKLK